MTLHIAQQKIRAITAERLCSLAVVSQLDTDFIGTAGSEANSMRLSDRAEMPTGGKHIQV